MASQKIKNKQQDLLFLINITRTSLANSQLTSHSLQQPKITRDVIILLLLQLESRQNNSLQQYRTISHFFKLRQADVRVIRKIQMQSIISDIYSLTLDLQQQNRNLLKLIEKYTSNRCLSAPEKPESCYYQSISKEIYVPQPKSTKFPDATSISRVSSSTIKQNSQRCKSVQSAKQSRVTKKNLSASKPSKVHRKDGQAVRQEPDLLRLRKITQKALGKISGSVLLKKKSKIYHFQTQY